MKRVKFNKKSLFIFILILGIGTTLAYFTSTVTISNIFTSLKYETTTTEEFTSPNDWKPGDTTPKTVVTKNNSNLPIRVRISVEESWTDKNNNALSLEENNTLAAILNLDNRPDWIYEDGYYYYKYDLPPGESTSSFIKSVTFNKDIVGEYICTTENNVEQCDSASDTYQAATYKLDIKVETTQADNYLDAWGLSRAPRRVAPTYCAYEGEITTGTEYINGQYTYRFNQIKDNTGWVDSGLNEDGWGVSVTDTESTEPITTPICTYINDKPVNNYSALFNNSKATEVDFSSYDTSEVINMNGMFANSRIRNIDISSFETSNVTDMSLMFYNCTNVRNADFSSFDTSNVTNMRSMFNNSRFITLDLSSFDTSNVTDMKSMFYKMTLLKELNISNFNTSKVTDMMNMFTYDSRIVELDLRNFDTSKVTDMRQTFAYMTKLEKIDLSSFDTSNVTSMYGMFYMNPALEEIKGIEDWDVSRVTSFGLMFHQNNALKRLDLKKWNTQSATGNAFENMFYYCTHLEYLDVSNFDTSNAQTFSRTFGALFTIEHINIANWDTSNVTNMFYFFVDNYKMQDIDLSSFKTDKVTDMAWMFYKNQEITKIYISDLWNTSNLTSTYMMFADNPKLTGEISNRYTMKPRINNLAISDSSTRTIHVGESITIPNVTATYSDNSVVTKESEDLIWKSSNLDIAKVNLGVVKGISPGEATITIKSGIVETTFNVVIVE